MRTFAGPEATAGDNHNKAARLVINANARMARSGVVVEAGELDAEEQDEGIAGHRYVE